MSTGVTSARGAVKEAPPHSPASTMGELEILKQMLAMTARLTDIERKIDMLLTPKKAGMWQRIIRRIGGAS